MVEEWSPAAATRAHHRECRSRSCAAPGMSKTERPDAPPAVSRAPPQPDWYDAALRGGTDAETLALALLVARGCGDADGAVRAWCDAVVADSPSYVDGELWRSPSSWRRERQSVPAAFKRLLGQTTEVQRRGVMCALALHDGPCALSVAPPESELHAYLQKLFAGEDKCLLGAGDETSVKRGAVRRSIYLQPRVARLVLARGAELCRLLESGMEAAVAAAVDEGAATPGHVGKSPSKKKLKETIADAEATIEHLGIALETAKKSRQQAVRRSQKKNSTAISKQAARLADRAIAADRAVAAARTAEATRARDEAEAECAKTAAQRDEARTLATESRREVKFAKAETRRLKRRRSDPTALRRLEKALAYERAENHALRVAAAAADEKIKQLLAAIEDAGTVELPRRARGKGAGRGLRHGTKLRRLYQELLSLNLFPATINAAIVKVSARTENHDALAGAVTGGRAAWSPLPPCGVSPCFIPRS